jgi:pyridoxine 4-dehydrogenase
MSSVPGTNLARASGTHDLGGDLPVVRLGYGAVHLPGPGVWGPPSDPAGALAVLRKAVEIGITFIDTADSYGPDVSEQLIREALHPYPDDLVVATKAGLTRQGPDRWVPLGAPAYLHQQAELSLRKLGVDRIDLFQLHRIDPAYPLEDQVGELTVLQDEGKIHHIGLSNVSDEQLRQARRIATIASVQNRYHVGARESDAVLDQCEAGGIAFIAYAPLDSGNFAEERGPVARAAERHGATPTQLVLAWLLHRSPVMVPIPGTRNIEHLVSNTAAASLALSDDEFLALSAVARS